MKDARSGLTFLSPCHPLTFQPCHLLWRAQSKESLHFNLLRVLQRRWIFQIELVQRRTRVSEISQLRNHL